MAAFCKGAEMKIEKRNYSRKPWRLIAADGGEVTARTTFEHPSLGWTAITEPVCGDTKAECTQKALDLLELLMRRQQSGAFAVA